jgi:hypothetical protein
VRSQSSRLARRLLTLLTLKVAIFMRPHSDCRSPLDESGAA